ncbi:MAG: sulfite exporter TauE/SafE family protein, partial [Actinomycetota bacterium]|nr:sulfite exporter TauE/SafE family protein [Actinomycetota bacterium]
GVGGPAVAMYALNAEWPVEMTGPTLQVYFMGLNILSLVALGPVSLPIGIAAGMFGATVAGVVAGTLVARRLDAASVVRAVLVLALAGGTAAVVRGIAQV